MVLAVKPWNYPWGQCVAVLAQALFAGNTVVLKPAPATTLVGLKLGELARKAGFPDGVVSVVAVDDAVAVALVEDPRVGKIVFTGSVATGRKVMASAAKNLTPVVLELGGKDPAIVCRDADLDRAAKGIVWAAFMNAGQTCSSVERVYVERPVAEAFLAKVLDETRRVRFRDAAGAGELGPLTLERQRRVVEEHVADAVAKGARVLTGGERVRGPRLLLSAHGARGRRPHDDADARGDVRPGAADHDRRLARRGDPPRQRQPVRPHRERLDAQRGDGAAAAARARGRRRLDWRPQSRASPSRTAPWGGVKWSGIGRIHGAPRPAGDGAAEVREPRPRRGIRAVVVPLRRRATGAWCRASAPALYSRSLPRRLAGQLGLMRFGRLWRRFGPWRLLMGLDKLF